jgi:hypothetical protein
VDRPLADQGARALRECRAVVPNLAPCKRPEEPDCVVLRAVTLPVASNDLLAPPLFAWRATRREQAIYRAREDITVLPRHGLAKRRVSGDVAQTRRLVVGTEGVKTADRKAGAANREVTAQSPISAKRDQVLVHRADPRSTAVRRKKQVRRFTPTLLEV